MSQSNTTAQEVTMPTFTTQPRADKQLRTDMQLAFCDQWYGKASSATFRPGSECPQCGAIPGFVHPADCTDPDNRPGLGTENPSTTAKLAAQLLKRCADCGALPNQPCDPNL
jgi:hypothetical protein